MSFDTLEIEKILGYSFKDKDLLKAAFTHRTYSNEHNCSDGERLEFLGDSLLGFVVADYLYGKFEQSDNEGMLTRYKQNLVSTLPLANAVKSAGLQNYLLVGDSINLNCAKADRIFENLFESLVAAIYLDGGEERAKEFIYNFLLSKAQDVKTFKIIDYKSDLQVFTQSKKLGQPEYRTLSKKGLEHAPVFTVEVLLNGESIAIGKGGSKSDASKQAAKLALEKLKNEDKIG